MGQTLAEKLLSVKVGRAVRAGEIVDVAVDLAYTWEGILPIFRADFESFGRPVWDPERIAINIDHFPAPNPSYAELIRETVDFAHRQGIRNLSQRGGVPNQQVIDAGLCRPGMVVVGTDSHAVTVGALCAFSTGIGTTEMLSVFLTGAIWFRVPESIRLLVRGHLGHGVTPKDLALATARRLGTDGASYMALEGGGPGIASLGISGRQTLCNLAVEMGAKVGLLPSDDRTVAFCEALGMTEIERIAPDPDANYVKTVELDLDPIGPLVAAPSSPATGVDVGEIGKGIQVDQAYIGTCSGGRLEDLHFAAEILRGRQVHDRVRLVVVPTTEYVYKEASADGTLAILAAAGATIQNANCGACLGMHQGVLGAGDVCISSGNRNYPGRMGHRDSAIYLASAYTVAASAIAGEIVDPREFLRTKLPL